MLGRVPVVRCEKSIGEHQRFAINSNMFDIIASLLSCVMQLLLVALHNP